MFPELWDGVYCGPPPMPSDLLLTWNLDPLLLGCLALVAYSVRHSLKGIVAVAVLFIAFVSPLCALSSALFSARVFHHVLLTAGVAPLFALTWPKRQAETMMLPFALFSVVFWFWHAPLPYDLALSSSAIYWLMQMSLMLSAFWFWREVFAHNRSPVESVSFIVLGFVQMGMLGAVLTFAPEPLYAAHALPPFDWNITPLTDQQFGGLVMWVPAGIPFAYFAWLAMRESWEKLRGDCL